MLSPTEMSPAPGVWPPRGRVTQGQTFGAAWAELGTKGVHVTQTFLSGELTAAFGNLKLWLQRDALQPQKAGADPQRRAPVGCRGEYRLASPNSASPLRPADGAGVGDGGRLAAARSQFSH